VSVLCSALDGVDECGVSTMDAPRRTLATPRRQLPVRSLIESDGLEFRWQNDVSLSFHHDLFLRRLQCNDNLCHTTMCRDRQTDSPKKTIQSIQQSKYQSTKS